jgi:hypothetical protein
MTAESEEVEVMGEQRRKMCNCRKDGQDFQTKVQPRSKHESK